MSAIGRVKYKVNRIMVLHARAALAVSFSQTTIMDFESNQKAAGGLTQKRPPRQRGVVAMIQLGRTLSALCRQSGFDLLFHQVPDKSAVAFHEGQLVREAALQQAADGKVPGKIGCGHQRHALGNAQMG